VPRIFEFRTYRLHPGKLEAFKERFAEGSVPFFAKHGILLHGFFEIGDVPADAVAERSAGGIVLPIVGTEFGQDQVAYLVSFDSAEARDAAWRAFVADPEWLELRQASEAGGPLVADETTIVLTPGEASPLQ
jgi:hypothetical protein